LSKAVRKGLRHDRAVIVMILFELLAERIQTIAGADSEGADIVGNSRRFRRNEIRQCQIELALRLAGLLSQRMDGRERATSRFVGIDVNVVAGAICSPEAEYAARLKDTLMNDCLEQALGVLEEFLRFIADDSVFQDLRV